MIIARLTDADLDALMEIEAHSFQSPNSRQNYLTDLDQDHAFLLGAKHPETKALLGYINFWIFADECHLHTLAISPTARRQGIGNALLTAMFTIAKEKKAHDVYLEVRPSNHAACSLYLKHHFKEVGRRPAYYPGETAREDAILMHLLLKP